MIHYLTGKIISRGENFVILENGGIGFKVFLTGEAIGNLPVADLSIKIFCHLYIREESYLELYGFLKEEELNFLDCLFLSAALAPKPLSIFYP